MKIPRFYQDLSQYLKPNKVIVIFGPRRVGKTTLLNDFLTQTKLKYKLESGDNIKIQQVLGSNDFDLIKDFVSGYQLIAIDEAQKIPHIGQGLKIIVDQIPGIQVIVTGSSSFELAGQIGEPLTGRKTTLILYPLSQIELSKMYNSYELKDKLSDWLIFGSYPEVILAASREDKIIALNEIINSYLLKDILELERVKGSKVLMDLLRLLAFQIGSEVSLSELAGQIGIDYKTVARYLDLFEKSFILYNLRGYSRNLRKEVTKKSKFYFYDVGLRNAIISNFNSLNLRDDIGKLWENFIFIERLKKQAYHRIYTNNFFWRTWDNKEIDLIEEREGKLFGYEIKWGKEKIKPPKDWIEAYKEATFEVINHEKYKRFIA